MRICFEFLWEFALNTLSEFDALFAQKQYQSLDDVLNNLTSNNFSTYIKQKQLSTEDINKVTNLMMSKKSTFQYKPPNFMGNINLSNLPITEQNRINFFIAFTQREDARPNINIALVHQAYLPYICANITLTPDEAKTIIESHPEFLVTNKNNLKYLSNKVIIQNSSLNMVFNRLEGREIADEDYQLIAKQINHESLIKRDLLVHKELIQFIDTEVLIFELFMKPYIKFPSGEITENILDNLFSRELTLDQIDTIVDKLPIKEADSWALLISHCDNFPIEIQMKISLKTGLMCINENNSNCKFDSKYLIDAYLTKNDDLLKYLFEHADKATKGDLLIEVIKNNDFEYAKYIIENGAPINYFPELVIWTPLKAAIYTNNITIFNYLIEKGAKTSYFGYDSALGYVIEHLPKEKDTFARKLLEICDAKEEMQLRDVLSDFYKYNFTDDILDLARSKGFHKLRPETLGFSAEDNKYQMNKYELLKQNYSLYDSYIRLRYLGSRKSPEIFKYFKSNEVNFNMVLAYSVRHNEFSFIETYIQDLFANMKQGEKYPKAINDAVAISDYVPHNFVIDLFSCTNIDFISSILDLYKIDINEVEDDSRYPGLALKCIESNDIQLLQFLIDRGLNINRMKHNGKSILTEIINNANEEMFQMVMKLNPSLETISTTSPFDSACVNHFHEYDLLPLINIEECQYLGSSYTKAFLENYIKEKNKNKNSSSEK